MTSLIALTLHFNAGKSMYPTNESRAPAFHTQSCRSYITSADLHHSKNNYDVYLQIATAAEYRSPPAGRASEAVECYLRAVECAPEAGGVWDSLAMAATALGHPELAEVADARDLAAFKQRFTLLGVLC